MDISLRGGSGDGTLKLLHISSKKNSYTEGWMILWGKARRFVMVVNRDTSIKMQYWYLMKIL